MKKLIAMLAAAALLVSGLCSCGDSGSKKKDKEKSSKTSHSDSKDKNEKDSEDDEDDDEDDDDKESGKKDKDKDKDKDSDKDKDKDSDNDKDKDSSSKVSASVSESDYVGKWELAKYIMDGEDLSEYMTDDMPIYALGQLEIKDGGKAKMKTTYAFSDELEEESTELEWEMKDSKTAVFHEADDEDSEDVFAVFEDDYLVLYSEEDDMKLYFEKVKSFHKIELPDVQDTTEPTTKPSVSGGSVTSTNSSDIAGKWECSEYKSSDVDFDYADLFGTDISAIFKMEIGSDGKGKLYVFYGSENEDSTEMEFTSIGDGKYSMVEDLDEDEYTVTVDGDKLTMTMATESLTFKRVKEFTETDWDKIFDDMMNQYGGQ